MNLNSAVGAKGAGDSKKDVFLVNLDLEVNFFHHLLDGLTQTVCVCVWERERKRESEGEGGVRRKKLHDQSHLAVLIALGNVSVKLHISDTSAFIWFLSTPPIDGLLPSLHYLLIHLHNIFNSLTSSLSSPSLFACLFSEITAL